MRKIKMALFFLAFLVITASFDKPKPPLSYTYWVFNGDPNIAGQVEDPENYDPVESPTCTSGTRLCNIYAEPLLNDPSHPNLATEITTLRTYKD